MRLGVIADTRHHLDGGGRACTLEPVAAQLERWADLFEEVILLVPVWPGDPLPGMRAYRATNMSVVALRPAGGPSLADKAVLAARVPAWTVAIARLVRRVDALHIRCPCNVGLLGVLAARVSGRHRYALYAGNWDGYRGEPASYRLQRLLLSRPSFGGPVTVYAAGAPAQPHLVPMFSPSFTLADWEQEEAPVAAKLAALVGAATVGEPLGLVSVGGLDANKDQATLIDAVAALGALGVEATLDLIGDGPLLAQLKARATSLGVASSVRFRGRQPLDVVMQAYRQTTFNLLASRSEGYPKVVVEGMVAGAVPVTSDFPMASTMLGGGTRGATFLAGDARGLARLLAGLAADPGRVAAMVEAGRAYSRTVTLDAYGDQVRRTLEAHWGLGAPVAGPPGAAAPAAGRG